MRQNSTAQRPIEPPRLPMATCHSEHQGYTFAFPRTVVWVPRSCPSALRRNSILAVQNGFNPPFRLDCLTQATSLLPSAVTAKRHAPAGLAGRPFAPHGGHQDPWELISNFSGIPRIPVDFERLLRGVPDRTIFARRRTILSQKNDRGQSDQKHSKMHIRIVSWAGRHFAI